MEALPTAPTALVIHYIYKKYPDASLWIESILYGSINHLVVGIELSIMVKL